MKKLILALALVTLVAASASAQCAAKPINFYLQGGATKVLGDFDDAYKIGYWGGGGIGFSIIPLIEAVGRVSYFYMSPDIPDDAEVDGGNLGILAYGVEAKLNLGSEQTRLFALAGAGWARIKLSEIEYEVGNQTHKVKPEATTENYLCAGAGLELGQFFLEGRFYKIVDELKTDYVDTDAGNAAFSFAAASIGIRF